MNSFGSLAVSEIGDFIKTRRQVLKKSQQDVATELTQFGMRYSDSSVSAWENGSNVPLQDTDFIRKLATVLRTTVAELYKAAGVLPQSAEFRRDVLVSMIENMNDKELAELEDFAEFLMTRKQRNDN